MMIANNTKSDFLSGCSCCCSGENEASLEGGNNSWKWKRRWKLDKDYSTRMDDDYHQDCYYDCALSTSTSSANAKSYLSTHNNACSTSRQNCVLKSQTSQTFSDYKIHENLSRNNRMQIHRVPPQLSSWLNFSSRISSTLSFVTFLNFLVIIAVAFLPPAAQAFPTSDCDCDWIGSGTPENVVQAVYLRCQQGHIIWERPRGGLRVNISPPSYFLTSRESFRLCLESNIGSNFQVFLEQTGSDENRKLLLPFINPKSSTCYRINSPTATLYVESQSQQEDSASTPSTTWSPSVKEAYQVKISYEIEELNSQEGSSDDECRPCSDQEVLQLYCVADVVARGEILSVHPSTLRKGLDTLHIKSDLVIHQNHAVFQPLKPGNKNLQKFLEGETRIFDQDSPKKIPKSTKSSIFGGIISHPSKCAAQSGPGEFLWLIKFSFGRPKIGCVLYWDRWVQLAQDASKSGAANCPLTFQ